MKNAHLYTLNYYNGLLHDRISKPYCKYLADNCWVLNQRPPGSVALGAATRPLVSNQDERLSLSVWKVLKA